MCVCVCGSTDITSIVKKKMYNFCVQLLIFFFYLYALIILGAPSVTQVRPSNRNHRPHCSYVVCFSSLKPVPSPLTDEKARTGGDTDGNTVLQV